MPKHRTSPQLCCRILPGLLLVMLVSQQPSVAADAPRGFVDRVYRDQAGDHKYVVFVPETYTPAKKWPVILFLHGAGERGKDGKRQTTVGLGPYVKSRAGTFPFIVVFPQAEDLKGRLLTGWLADSADGQRALKILDAVETEFSVDKSREILTGWSMGGYGTWSIAAATPGRWSAVVPLAGGGDKATAKKLKDLPIWVFHGADDAAIRPEVSREMVQAVRAAGGRPRYDEVVGVGHSVWKVAYNNDDLYAWMLHPVQGGPSTVRLRAKPGTRPAIEADTTEPFIPAVEIPRAVYIRLGNDMLETLAYSIPKITPPDVLSGELDDIYDSTTAQGRYFNVVFSGIRYSGELARTIIKAYKKERLNIQLGLRNVTLSIGTSYVSGSGRSAVAGPIDVVIGHRRPVWLSLAVKPYVEDRKLRLKLIASRFVIPDDNWYVTSPAGVSTRGLGMTRERVSSGLVSGLYGSKGRIEQEVVAVVPSLLARLEENLELTEVDQLVNSFWPLPVYRPRVRVWPEAVATDENGVSIVLGVTAAAVDPQSAPKSPRRVKPLGPAVDKVPRGTSLRVGISPNMLQPLTELLIQADVARIHVRDIPEKTFASFADRQVLAAAIPDLKRYPQDVEIWAELILAKPLSVEGASTVGAALCGGPKTSGRNGTESVPYTGHEKTNTKRTVNGNQDRNGKSDAGLLPGGEAETPPDRPARHPPSRLRFNVPKVIVSLAIKTDPKKADWTPYADFEFELVQQAEATIVRPTFETRALRMDWFGEPQLKATAHFAYEYQPHNPELKVDVIRELFLRGWRGWTGSGPASVLRVADVDFGFTKLRLSEVGWSDSHLYAEFAEPGVMITNSSEVPLVYETKGPYSDWGGPYTLEPGESHEFDIFYPLSYRSRTAAGVKQFTLPVGTHSEYRVPRTGGPPQLFEARETIPKKTPSNDE